MLSLEKLTSGRVTRPSESDSPRGQRRPHPPTTGGQSNSSETHGTGGCGLYVGVAMMKLLVRVSDQSND